MTASAEYEIHQLVLSVQHPQWGYGRIVQPHHPLPEATYWVYFYHTDTYVDLHANALQTVPDNYQPPFAPDPDLFFHGKQK
ncbi:MAG: hypothetical protein CMH56_07395 [Myxococcales bacterium]|nr:hypothetical protein [Myxococcales bacterium]